MYTIPEDRWLAMTPQNRRRIEGEKDVLRLLVKNALAAGCRLSVDDGDEMAIENSTDEKAVLDALYNTDEDKLYYHGPLKGWVYLVYGNDASEVINDYTTNLEDHLKPVFDHCEALEQKDA